MRFSWLSPLGELNEMQVETKTKPRETPIAQINGCVLMPLLASKLCSIAQYLTKLQEMQSLTVTNTPKQMIRINQFCFILCHGV